MILIVNDTIAIDCEAMGMSTIDTIRGVKRRYSGGEYKFEYAKQPLDLALIEDKFVLDADVPEQEKILLAEVEQELEKVKEKKTKVEEEAARNKQFITLQHKARGKKITTEQLWKVLNKTIGVYWIENLTIDKVMEELTNSNTAGLL